MKKPGLLVCLLLAACASTSSDTSPGTTAAGETKKAADPTVGIARLEVNSAQPASATSVPLIVRVKVENRTEEAVTVDRIEVASVGVGPYTINSTATDFHHEVKVGHVSVFPVWVQGIPGASSPSDALRRGVEESIGGQEGALMMRASVYVTSANRAQHRISTVQKVETSLTH